MAKKVIAIIGSYRKGHVIDSAVSAVLEGAAQAGAETEKVYLLETVAHVPRPSRSRQVMAAAYMTMIWKGY
ncbi:MAG: hypothetical protein ACYSWP_15285 [Planctomycetota bacterium]|jgi:hypothetical protein